MTESVRKVVALFDLHSDDAESLAQAIDEYLTAARAQDAERIRELEDTVKAEQAVSEARRVALCQFRDERDAALVKVAALEREHAALRSGIAKVFAVPDDILAAQVDDSIALVTLTFGEVRALRALTPPSADATRSER